jgi:cytochrome c-type biogenesis protein CcsB
MKKISNFLFSSRLMVILILLFALSIAIATFIENDFGSQTARATIYNAWWFNLLLLAGIVNLAGTILKAQLYRKEKVSIFTFHLAFLLILVGAAITRFFGSEGYMHIREGESSNRIISGDNYFKMTASNNGEQSSVEKRVYFSSLSDNYLKLNLTLDDKKFTAECLQMIPDAREFAAADPSGRPVIEMVVSGTTGRQTIVLSEGMNRVIGGVEFTINEPRNIDGVNINAGDSGLFIYTPVQTVIMDMATQQADTINGAQYYDLRLMSLYNFNGLMVVPRVFLPAGKIDVKTDKKAQNDELPYALLIKISSGMQSKSIRYFASENALNDPVIIDLDGTRLEISFGSQIIQVPFELKLDKFILERYPGSESPSWFESKIVLTDIPAGIQENRRVYMNNVLKYKGYRFYQSSYDTDEKGTIFSVNHDLAGTLVTYAGYLLLAAGIVLSLLNKKSRFRKLSLELDTIRRSSIPFVGLLVVFFSIIVPYNSLAQSLPDSVFIDREQAAKFSELLIQDPGGRIKPVNTLSSELVRKVSGKTSLMRQTPDQVFLGMLAYPEYWQNVPMIKISHPEIKKILRTNSTHVTFASVFDLDSKHNPYILGKYVNEAYQKKPAARNPFDTELIRIDERINLCYQIYAGNLLRIFPDGSDPAGTWHSPANMAGVFTGKDSIFASSILPLYLQSLTKNADVLNLMTPDEALNAMRAFQIRFGNELIPPPFKIRMEIFYNRVNLFDRLGNYYGAIGLILLIIYFGSVFYPQIKIRPFYLAARFAVYLAFFLHLAGLVARWIISGHAPWSNGYEALVYIAFATVLAGIIFSKKSQITLPVTAILAWLILFVAHLNWMDPEITNLVPVLKSYWLLIHVAIITASYGFLAMGALLAFTNLVLMIVQTRKNYPSTGRMIAEFSIIIEMTLISGLYMLTIGTFLGGVWANESWGRYWGWDPKETWALVSILIYAFVAHMRLVPGLKGNYIFNLFAFLSFSSIIMTYFGVNYYLSGLHSYAKGDPLPVPPFVYYTLAVSGLVALLAWENQRRMRRAGIFNATDKQKPSMVVESLNRQEKTKVLK